jgi:hypothetical protein
MTSANRAAIIRSLTMVAALIMSVSTVTAQNSQSDASERTIVGVWRTTVTPLNCQTGEPVGVPPIRGLFTFNEGGTMSEYGIGPGSSPALRSPGHGVWQHEHGWQDYSFVFTYYRYNTSGALVGSQKVSASLELNANGDEFTTQSAIQILDATDNVTGTACATAAGTRFE